MIFRICIIICATVFALLGSQKLHAQVEPVDSLFKYYELYDMEKAAYWADQIEFTRLGDSNRARWIRAIAGLVYYYVGKKEFSERLYTGVFEDYRTGQREKDSTYVALHLLYGQTRLNQNEQLAEEINEMKLLMPLYYDQYDYEMAVYHLMVTKYLYDAEDYDSALYHADISYELNELHIDGPNIREVNVILASLLSIGEKRPELVLDLLKKNQQYEVKTPQQMAEKLGADNLAAIQYFENLEYVKSERMFLEQQKLIEQVFKGKENKQYMISAMNLSRIYLRTNRYEEAYALISPAKKFFESSDLYLPELLSAKNSLASYYRGIGQPDKGVAMHREVLQTKIDKGMLKSSIALSRLNYTASLISSYEDMPDPAKLDLADSLISASSNTYIDLFDENYSGNLIGRTYMVRISLLREDWLKALEDNTQLLRAKKNKLGTRHNLYASSLIDQAIILLELDKVEEAAQYYQHGVETYLDYVLDYLPYTKGKAKREFWRDFEGRVNRYLWMLVENRNRLKAAPEMLGKFILDTKSIMYDFHSTRLLLENAKGKPELEDWAKLRSQLSAIYAAGAAEVQDTTKMQRLIRKVEAMEKELSIFLPANLIGEKQNMVEVLKSRLQPNEAYLELLRLKAPDKSTEDSVYYLASVFTHDDVKLHVFSNGNDLEGKHLNRYRDDLLNRRQVYDSYTTYWQPIANLIQGKSKVYVNPDGVFNLISLHSLRPFRSKKAVRDDFELTLIGSTRSFLANNEGETNGKKAMLMGAADIEGLPVLYNVDQEIDDTQKRLNAANWNVEVRSGDDALMPAKSAATELGLWHFAGHAFLENKAYAEGFSDAGFLRSGLHLAPRAGVPSGKLLAYDIMNYDLRKTQLVVLSACETGLGVIDNGNGVMNLRTAFSLAGAGSTLMSLWKVDDESTRLFMNAFYQSWLSNGDKIKAFQAAQNAVRANNPHPYYWGAFVLSEQ